MLSQLKHEQPVTLYPEDRHRKQQIGQAAPKHLRARRRVPMDHAGHRAPPASAWTNDGSTGCASGLPFGRGASREISSSSPAGWRPTERVTCTASQPTSGTTGTVTIIRRCFGTSTVSPFVGQRALHSSPMRHDRHRQQRSRVSQRRHSPGCNRRTKSQARTRRR